ncbi:bifunctional glutamate/proline--tRNA ligase-like [Artemia franciscana]|uniref:bifunctional glutamate/proline--tRNA ligase-like n=1 Tax=Artemia franciscana TaxID=6661 RepID=UPI0032DBCC20
MALTGSDWKPTTAPVVTAAKSASTINSEIAVQGDKVRDLKSKKADKATIDSEVKSLLALKAEFKALTGSDWKPTTAPVVTAAKSANQSNSEIAAQGEKVRDLKSKKADKATIDSEVKSLLVLKAEFKALTGSDWKPTAAPVVTAAKSANQINSEIAAQGDKVRDLKSKKADKATIDSEVKFLLALKAEFKALTDSDWKPTTVPVVTTVKSADQINSEIIAQGEKVRDLKSKKADKATIDLEVKSLLALKAEFKAITGSDWQPTAALSVATAKPSDQLNYEIAAQVDKVDKEIRKLINELLRLKSEFKLLTGNDWKPATAVPESKESMCLTSVKDNSTDEKELLKNPQEQKIMDKIDVTIGAGPTRTPKSSKKEDTKRESKKVEKRVEKKAANSQVIFFSFF